MNWRALQDPFKLSKVLWPKSCTYDKQDDITRSIWKNDKTICIAGNKLGKDYIAARIALVFFLTRQPCRIITTSVNSTQLESVLWGEIKDAIQKSAIPLLAEHGGPLLYNHLHIRRVFTSGPNKGQECGLSYIRGIVSKKGEGFLGHHIADVGDGIPRTLLIVDEASGLDDSSLEKVETWANRQLYIGNAFECSNMFYKESEAGDVPDPATIHLPPEEKRYYTKVIRITGHDSPNVRYAKAYERANGTPTNKLLIPGVLPYYEYKKWMNTWDKIRISISIDAQFYKGSELLLFPPEWLNHAHQIHRDLRLKVKRRRAVAIGCDPGEGAAESAWAVVDEYGVLETLAYQTPNTSDVPKQTLALMRKWDVPAHMVMFDYGGGGIQHANHMRSEGYHVRTVGFGEPVQPPPKRGQTTIKHQIEQREEKYFYKTRRVEMYGKFSELLNPNEVPDNGIGFGIPDSDLELRRQLALIPKKYGKEGELWLPPKNKKDKNSKEQTLIDIIGCSPDRADALVISIYAMQFSPRRSTAGVA